MILNKEWNEIYNSLDDNNVLSIRADYLGKLILNNSKLNLLEWKNYDDTDLYDISYGNNHFWKTSLNSSLALATALASGYQAYLYGSQYHFLNVKTGGISGALITSAIIKIIDLYHHGRNPSDLLNMSVFFNNGNLRKIGMGTMAGMTYGLLGIGGVGAINVGGISGFLSYELLNYAEKNIFTLSQLIQHPILFRSYLLQDKQHLSFRELTQLDRRYNKLIDLRNYQGETFLIKATRQGNIHLMEKLFQNGANINGKDNTNLTPLLHAIITKNLLATETLIDLGADTSWGENYNSDNLLRINQNHINAPLMTPMELAIASGFIDGVKLLIKKGLSIDNSERNDAINPLMLAANYQQLEMFKFIHKKYSSQYKTHSGDIFGRTFLLHAVSGFKYHNQELLSLHKKLLIFILKYVSPESLDQGDFEGNTPLLFSLMQKNMLSAQTLISLGANVDLANKRGETALGLAIAHQFDNLAEDIFYNRMQNTVINIVNKKKAEILKDFIEREILNWGYINENPNNIKNKLTRDIIVFFLKQKPPFDQITQLQKILEANANFNVLNLQLESQLLEAKRSTIMLHRLNDLNNELKKNDPANFSVKLKGILPNKAISTSSSQRNLTRTKKISNDECSVCMSGPADGTPLNFRIKGCGHPLCDVDKFRLFTCGNYPLKCPKDGCENYIGLDDANVIFAGHRDGENELNKFISKTIFPILRNYFGHFECSTANCENMLVKRNHLTSAYCESCDRNICSNCFGAHQDNITCLEHLSGDKGFNQLLHDPTSTLRPCPWCHKGNQKTDACNHYQCAYCAKKFDLVTGKVMAPHATEYGVRTYRIPGDRNKKTGEIYTEYRENITDDL